MSSLSWEVMENVTVVAQSLHHNKEKLVKTFIKKTSTEGFGVIDLDLLYEEKEVFHFFAEHLSYPDEYLFGSKMELPFSPTHPGYISIKKFCQEMSKKNLDEIQSHYSETFDFQKDATLFMTYVKFEDSKGRGQMLARLKVLYEMFGLMMPKGELSDLLPLMCEFIYAAEWKGDPRAQQSFSLLLAVLEDGSYHLMNALKKYKSPYYYLIRGMREAFKVCIIHEEAQAND